jgi:hypothetical protein
MQKVSERLSSRRIAPTTFAWLTRASGLACFAALIWVCYGTALLHHGQFAFRDSGHYYYPLYQRVQEEWRAGRLPLWEPGENGGTALLGNPTAAVFYPGKLIYTLFPYARAARFYVVAHTTLACVAMAVLMRSWGVSPAGTAIAALGYGFGAPVLFQYFYCIHYVRS